MSTLIIWLLFLLFLIFSITNLVTVIIDSKNSSNARKQEATFNTYKNEPEKDLESELKKKIESERRETVIKACRLKFITMEKTNTSTTQLEKDLYEVLHKQYNHDNLNRGYLNKRK